MDKQKRKRKPKQSEDGLSFRVWFIYVFLVLLIMFLPLINQMGLGWYGVFFSVFSALFYAVLFYLVLRSRQE